MRWSDFGPYVMPYVLGCPEPLMVQHVRLAAIEFCRRTSCYQATLELEMKQGASQADLSPDPGTQINRVLAVGINGRSWPLVSAKQGQALLRADSPQDFCFTADNLVLHVAPVPTADQSGSVDAVLTPTITSHMLDDAVALAHLQDIAMGAVASLQQIPGQAFTDLKSAVIQQAQFNARITTVAAKMARGLVAAKMPSYTSYL